jgi:hypothetical protein
MLYGGTVPLVAASVTSVVLVALLVVRPESAILATLAFLALMGDFRRLLLRDSSGGNDPVLLVGPIIAAILFAMALIGHRLNRTSTLSKLVSVLMGWMVLEIFNPQQGGIMVGIVGALFYLVPLLWFWIGQSWGSYAFTQSLLYRVVVPIAVAASLMGLQQAFNGLLPYQQRWATQQYGNVPLQMGANLRPFSFFVSTAEYACYLSLACALPLAAWFAGQLRLSLFVVPLLIFALFMDGCRGPLVMAIGAIIVTWAMLSKNAATGLFRAGIAVVFVVAGMAWTFSQVQDLGVTGDTGKLISHQIDGLSDPTNDKKSTLGVHQDLVTIGLLSAVKNPIGAGLGSTTLAAVKFGNGGGASSESDYGDAFLAMGLIGGALYFAVVFQVMRTAYSYWRQSREPLGLAIMGLLVTGLGRWLLGAAYAQVALTWFCIGALDRIVNTRAPGAEPATVRYQRRGSRQACLPSSLNIASKPGVTYAVRARRQSV